MRSRRENGASASKFCDGEHDCLSQLMYDAIGAVLLDEEAGEPLWRDVGLDLLWIDAVARKGHAVCVDVGGKDLQLDVALGGCNLLEEQYGDRIGLFARAAAGNPDAQRPVERLLAHQLWDDLLRQQIERLSRRGKNV